MESAEVIQVNNGYAGIIHAWRNAAARYVIPAPDRYVRVVLHFSDRAGNYEDGEGHPLHETEAFYSHDLNYWNASVPPECFPEGGEVLFKVQGEDTDGKRKVLGAGKCRIATGFTDDPSDVPQPAQEG